MTKHGFLSSNFLKTFEDAFYFFPQDPKPPIDFVYGREDEVDYVEIQLALAGYSQEELKVYTEGSVVVIEGDNTKNEKISNKFQSKFERSISVTKYYDITKSEVDFDNGLLRIKIPIADNVRNKTLLFGKS